MKQATLSIDAENSTAAHTLTIAVMRAGLGNMLGIMDKAAAHAATDTSKADLLNAQLYPDMFNLLQQLQYMCYLAVDFARHFTETSAPRVGYDEETWPDLRRSLTLARDYLDAVRAGAVSGAIEKPLPTFMDETKFMPAVDYAARVIIPDFHFHMVIAYGIFRHKGIPLGKADFLGALPFLPTPN